MTVSNTPRLSVLIPNYNNGRDSSIGGQFDLIGDLLQSLHDTLYDDPTPLEILCLDDGSTDDSLETLRKWSKRTWRNGQPFLELIEREHCGVLSVTANILSRRAQGDILARLDGDTRCLTPHWAEKLCAIFDSADDRLGVVGPKQLRPDMKIHAFGDFVLYPGGYTHVVCGAPRHHVKHRLEVDHVMGCFYCCRKAVYDDLGGYDENILRGQTVDFGLRARLNGYRCIAVPDIEFVHAHGHRDRRANRADTAEGVRHTLNVFQEKWGFDRIAPDLDDVLERYRGTPLLWNRAVWDALDAPPRAATPITPERSDYARFASDADFQRETNFRLSVVAQVLRQAGPQGTIVQLGCEQGLLVHLLAREGLKVVGVDSDEAAIDLAQRTAERSTYPSERPQFIAHTSRGEMPLPDQSADLLLLFDVLERDANPVGLLKAARRIVKPGALIAIVSRRRFLEPFDPTAPEHRAEATRERRYLWGELLNQLQAVGGFTLAIDPNSDDDSRDMIVILRRAADAASPRPVGEPAGAAV